MSSKAARNQRGSLLLESMVAIGLFAIGAAAVAKLLVQHDRLEIVNGTATAAIAVAVTELESIRALDYASMVSRSSSNVVNGTAYTVQTTVQADTPQTNLKTVTTQVTWNDVGGAESYAAYAVYTAVSR